MQATTPTAAPRPGYPTHQAAALLVAKPGTLRVALCERGEYLGIKPVKLPNGRLLWPADEVDRVARGEPLTTAAPQPHTRRRRGWIDVANAGEVAASC